MKTKKTVPRRAKPSAGLRPRIDRLQYPYEPKAPKGMEKIREGEFRTGDFIAWRNMNPIKYPPREASNMIGENIDWPRQVCFRKIKGAKRPAKGRNKSTTPKRRKSK